MTGEEFLRRWAAEVVADGDLEWWPRFSSMVRALEIVDAIDIDVAREIGQNIRIGLTAVTGEPTHDFYLGSRHADQPRDWGPIVPPPTAAPKVSVRSASASLPASVGVGATHFVAVEADEAWLVCSGPGLAPWSEAEVGAPSPPFLGIVAVVDDLGRQYDLTFRASSAPARGEPRQRWSLTTGLQPVPDDDVKWLELVTAHGPVRVHLRSPLLATTATIAFDPPPAEIEHHLRSELHNQVWLHLLDPERALDPLGSVIEALTAVAAVDRAHPLVAAVLAVDAAVAGKPCAVAPPGALAAALGAPMTAPWVGAEALDVSVQLDGAFLALEALIGHHDRFELYFLEPPMSFLPGPETMSAHRLIIWATDNLGGGYVGHAESGDHEGLYHLRPPLDSAATLLSVHLEGPAHGVTVAIDLSSAASQPAQWTGQP
jgi:hypothetical protein